MTRLNIKAEEARLRKMTHAELRAEYERVYDEPTRSGNRAYLTRRILWRLQAIEEGDLPERVRQRAIKVARDADLRLNPPRDGSTPTITGRLTSDGLRVGSVISRIYKKRTIAVTVLDDGFEFEGETYRSLTAIAKAITGSHWNGRHFFGLTDKQKEDAA